MSDQDERKHRTEGEEHAPEQQPRKTPPATVPKEEKDSTISLLDLMRETTGSEEPGLPEEDTAEIPTPLFVTPPEEDDPTVTITGDATPQAPTTPKPSPLPLSQEAMRAPSERPLEYDPEATEVQPRVAFSPARPAAPAEEAPTEIHTVDSPSPIPPAATRQVTRRSAPVQPPKRQPTPVRMARPAAKRNWGGCAIRLFLFLLIAGIVLLTLSIAGAAMGYTAIARTLPRPSELSARASTFETVRIFDRTGNLLYSQADPNTGNRLYVPLNRISPHLINAAMKGKKGDEVRKTFKDRLEEVQKKNES